MAVCYPTGHVLRWDRRGNRLKIVLHDGYGLWLAQWRLHQGRFHWPSGQERYALTAAQFPSPSVTNVLQRDFSAAAPNQKWGTDITEFNLNGQKLYLSACMDLYNGEIIAHRMARRPVFELVSGTLRAALSQLGSAAGLTVHSDQGWHYKMQPYQSLLTRRGATQSMSRKDNCFHNAAIESFFGTLKAEYFRLETLYGLESLEAGVDDYIRYYNHERIKLGLQGLSPVACRLSNAA